MLKDGCYVENVSLHNGSRRLAGRLACMLADCDGWLVGFGVGYGLGFGFGLVLVLGLCLGLALGCG